MSPQVVEIRLAPLLHLYTGGIAVAQGQGGTLGAVFDDLDRQYPGIRFRLVDEQDRLRRHVRCFVNETDARDMATELRPGDRIFLVGALSGG